MPHNGFHPALSPTVTSSTNDPFASGLLTSSISSLSSSTTSARHPSQISKTYRQSSTLFLTRRLPEALTTLLPLITPSDTSSQDAVTDPAPVAVASRTTRIKVWSLYLTILNAIVELEPDEGKDAFGAQEWRGLCAKVRDSAIWEEVVKNGYHGVEGDVDSDVVINLATLLLAHARDQTLNQKRLETYLASSNTPSLDISGRLSESRSPGPRVGRLRAASKGRSGAGTPRDLNARVKILELYTLHVLLRNNEWEYAREFISVSSVLDEERREAFLQALQSLQEEQQEQDRREAEERQRQEEQLRNDIEIARRLRAENEERERKRLEDERAKREGSEVDYGVEDTTSVTGSSRSRHARNQSNASAQPPPARAPNQKARGKAVAQKPPTLTSQAAMIMARLRAVVYQIGTTLNNNPASLMRFLAFIMGLLLVLGHKGIRQRLRQTIGASWNKVKATAGMGTKVSYI